MTPSYITSHHIYIRRLFIIPPYTFECRFTLKQECKHNFIILTCTSAFVLCLSFVINASLSILLLPLSANQIVAINHRVFSAASSVLWIAAATTLYLCCFARTPLDPVLVGSHSSPSCQSSPALLLLRNYCRGCFPVRPE